MRPGCEFRDCTAAALITYRHGVSRCGDHIIPRSVLLDEEREADRFDADELHDEVA